MISESEIVHPYWVNLFPHSDNSICPVVSIILASYTLFSLPSSSWIMASALSQVSFPEMLNILVFCFSWVVPMLVTISEDTGWNINAMVLPVVIPAQAGSHSAAQI